MFITSKYSKNTLLSALFEFIRKNVVMVAFFQTVLVEVKFGQKNKVYAKESRSTEKVALMRTLCHVTYLALKIEFVWYLPNL